MQIFAEINALPIEKPSPLMLDVKNMIQETLENLLPFADQPATENVISKVRSLLLALFLTFRKFNSKLGDYIQRHRTAVDEVALAILEFKDEQLEMAQKGLSTFDLEDAEEKVSLELDQLRYFCFRCIISLTVISRRSFQLISLSTSIVSPACSKSRDSRLFASRERNRICMLESVI